MRHFKSDRINSARCGITLVEVIVIVLAVLLLMSLILPAIQSSRPHQRRHMCLNNLKNLGLAATNYANYANGHHGYLPPLSSELSSPEGQVGRASWVITLFPYLDRADVVEYLQQAKTSSESVGHLQEVLARKYEFLQCRNDPRHFRQPGGISYAPNIGYGAWWGINAAPARETDGVVARYDFNAKDHSLRSTDWNANGKSDNEDAEVAASTGVLWNLAAGEGSCTLQEINDGDGTSSTLLFIESLTLPLMHQTGPSKNGVNPRALEIGSGLGYGSLGFQKQSPPNIKSKLTSESLEFKKYFRPNASVGKAMGTWPGASSNHNGIVNVVFAGGNATSISQDIDWQAWAALHSPNGVKWGERRIRDSEY